MISYAQNREDVLLQRCFANDPPGFYIDVGAWDPVQDSVTKHFYDQGWRGINVEPVPEFFDRLVEARPRDINLDVALSDHEEASVPFSVLEGSGISTLRELPDEYVDAIATAYGFQRKTISVEARTLTQVCQEHVPVGQEIRFLKIDVEGWELQVLRGHSWQEYRPKVVVVESLTPRALDPTTHTFENEDGSRTWEPILLDHGYLSGFHDGINRFYVREEDHELLECFAVPVNCLDHYVDYRQVVTEEGRRALTTEVEQLENAVDIREQTIRGLTDRLEIVERRLDALMSSRSWKMTAPLRRMRSLLRQSNTAG